MSDKELDHGLTGRLLDEADLCRNDGADDIARLLDEAAAEIERLRRVINRACAGYPADDASPTYVAILRAALVDAAWKPAAVAGQVDRELGPE